MEKQVGIVVAASGEIKDVALSPGATVREVLNEAGLQGYQLSRKGGEPLDPNTDLFEEATDAEKFFATPQDVSVGDGGSASSFSVLNFMRTIDDMIKKSKTNGKRRRLRAYRDHKVRVIGNRPLSLKVNTHRARFKGQRRYKEAFRGTP